MSNGPTIHLIRHGEKPPPLPNGKDAPGLSAQGVSRANALPTVFGRRSQYHIGYIIAEKPEGGKHEKHSRPYETILPLAGALGLPINAEITREDVQAVADAAKAWNGDGDVLICWEHHALGGIASAIGVRGDVTYPDDRFDLVWTVRPPYDAIAEVGSEGVVGLDVNVGAGAGGPDAGGEGEQLSSGGRAVM